MRTGWLQDGANWYYLAANGVMQSSCWIGDYYVLDSGAMARNQWVGQYYVGADGLWDGHSWQLGARSFFRAYVEGYQWRLKSTRT